MWDRDLGKGDDFLGEVEIPLREMKVNHQLTKTLILDTQPRDRSGRVHNPHHLESGGKGRSGKRSGPSSLHVSVHLKNFNNMEDLVSPALGPTGGGGYGSPSMSPAASTAAPPPGPKGEFHI